MPENDKFFINFFSLTNPPVHISLFSSSLWIMYMQYFNALLWQITFCCPFAEIPPYISDTSGASYFSAMPDFSSHLSQCSERTRQTAVGTAVPPVTGTDSASASPPPRTDTIVSPPDALRKNLSCHHGSQSSPSTACLQNEA